MLQDKSALEKYKPHLFIEIKRENIDAEDLNDIVNYVEKLSQNTGCQGRILLKDKQKNKTATLLTKDYNFKPLEGESNLFYLSTDGIKK